MRENSEPRFKYLRPTLVDKEKTSLGYLLYDSLKYLFGSGDFNKVRDVNTVPDVYLQALLYIGFAKKKSMLPYIELSDEVFSLWPLGTYQEFKSKILEKSDD